MLTLKAMLLLRQPCCLQCAKVLNSSHWLHAQAGVSSLSCMPACALGRDGGILLLHARPVMPPPSLLGRDTPLLHQAGNWLLQYSTRTCMHVMQNAVCCRLCALKSAHSVVSSAPAGRPSLSRPATAQAARALKSQTLCAIAARSASRAVGYATRAKQRKQSSGPKHLPRQRRRERGRGSADDNHRRACFGTTFPQLWVARRVPRAPCLLHWGVQHAGSNIIN